MKRQVFIVMNPVHIVGFLYTFKMAFDISTIHEGAAMWLFPHIMKNSAATTQSSRLSLQSK